MPRLACVLMLLCCLVGSATSCRAAARSLATPPAPGATVPAAAMPEVNEMPLLELPTAANASDTFAILLSGDGGWSGIDKVLAQALNAHGISVVGWDSLHYFWTARTPDGAARDLDRVLRHYAQAWHKSRVLLLGFSQGADTLPFMINRLPPASARRVRATVLIAISDEAQFEFHVSHWLHTPQDGLPTRPEVMSGRLGTVYCVHGAEDADSACSDLRGGSVRVIALPGGHHFDGDYEQVATAVLTALGL